MNEPKFEVKYEDLEKHVRAFAACPDFLKFDDSVADEVLAAFKSGQIIYGYRLVGFSFIITECLSYGGYYFDSVYNSPFLYGHFDVSLAKIRAINKKNRQECGYKRRHKIVKYTGLTPYYDK